EETRLRVWVVDQCLRQHRRASLLTNGVSSRGKHALRLPIVEKTGQNIEPVDGEVVQHEIANVVERRVDDPRMGPVGRQIGAGKLTEQPTAYRLPEVGEVRRPAPVLVDRQLQALPVGEVSHAFTKIEIEHKWFLAEHVLARQERLLDDRSTLRRMGGDVN